MALRFAAKHQELRLDSSIIENLGTPERIAVTPYGSGILIMTDGHERQGDAGSYKVRYKGSLTMIKLGATAVATIGLVDGYYTYVYDRESDLIIAVPETKS